MGMDTLSADWVRLGNRLGVNFVDIAVAEWIKGCDHELEHWKTVNGNPIIIARIALDHLREDPRYYQKLEKMEHEKALHL